MEKPENEGTIRNLKNNFNASIKEVAEIQERLEKAMEAKHKEEIDFWSKRMENKDRLALASKVELLQAELEAVKIDCEFQEQKRNEAEAENKDYIFLNDVLEANIMEAKAENAKYKKYVDSNLSAIQLQDELDNMTQSRDHWREMKYTAETEWRKCMEELRIIKSELCTNCKERICGEQKNV